MFIGQTCEKKVTPQIGAKITEIHVIDATPIEVLFS